MESSTVSIGDRWYVVVIVYFAVLLPWTIFQTMDFIGPTWTTVKKTRLKGRRHFCVTLFPLGAMIPYIIFQIDAGDFKEMFTAFLALVFALLHLLRTWWGLWQLDQFRKWASKSIQTLEAHGVKYDLNLSDEQKLEMENLSGERLYTWKADHIEVNENIVDNQIMEGNARCYLEFKYSGLIKNFGMNISTCMRQFKSIIFRKAKPLQKVFKRVSVLMKSILNSIHPIFRILYRLRDLFSIRVHEPTEVWIRWSSCFASQGMSNWIDTYDIVPHPRASLGAQNDYDQREEYYSRELLTTAYFLTNGADNDEATTTPFGKVRSSPFEYQKYFENEDLWFDESGKLSQIKMLTNALRKGTGLPFNTPHIDDSRKASQISSKLEKQGLMLYAYDVQKEAQSLPAKFGNAINKFNYQMLESLTIMLAMGSEISFKSSLSEEQKDLSGSEKRDEYFENLEDDDHQIMILKKQLGLNETARLMSTRDVLSKDADQNNATGNFLGPMTIPILREKMYEEEGQNGKIKDVMSLLDIWCSINAGDLIQEMFLEERFWSDICINSSLSRRETKSRDRFSTPKEIRRLRKFRHDKILPRSLSAGNATHQRNPENHYSLLEVNRELENSRLRAEFGLRSGLNTHLDQRITFLGVSMESLRSCFAFNLNRNPRKFMDWLPKIDFDPDSPLQSKKVLQFSGSDYITSALHYSVCTGRRFCDLDQTGIEECIRKVLQKKTTKTRLIWEVQRVCAGKLSEKVFPSSNLSMFLCVLSFPSLKVSVDKIEFSSTIDNGNEHVVDFTSFSCSVKVCPIGSPQNIYLELILDLKKSELSKYHTSISGYLHRKYLKKDFRFDWEAWRDSFSGRLDGAKEWKSAHKIPWFSTCKTYFPISHTITTLPVGERKNPTPLKVWIGWLPNHPLICEFEFHHNPDLIRRNIGKMKPNPVVMRVVDNFERDFIDKKLLQISSMQHSISEEGLSRMGQDVLQNFLGHEQLLRFFQFETLEHRIVVAMQKLDEGSLASDIDDAIGLFGIAVANGKREGLRATISILSKKTIHLTSYRKLMSLMDPFIKFAMNNRELQAGIRSEMEDWYETLVSLSDYDIHVVESYSKFFRKNSIARKKDSITKLFEALQVTFMKSGSVSILRELYLHSQIDDPQKSFLTKEIGLLETIGQRVWLTEKLEKRIMQVLQDFKNQGKGISWGSLNSFKSEQLDSFINSGPMSELE